MSEKSHEQRDANAVMVAQASLVAFGTPSCSSVADPSEMRRDLMARRVAVGMARERLREHLDEVLVELEDAAQALAEAAAEQELGLPSFTIGALEARVQRYTARSTNLSQLLETLDAVQEQLSREANVADQQGASTVFRAG